MSQSLSHRLFLVASAWALVGVVGCAGFEVPQAKVHDVAEASANGSRTTLCCYAVLLEVVCEEAPEGGQPCVEPRLAPPPMLSRFAFDSHASWEFAYAPWEHANARRLRWKAFTDRVRYPAAD